MRTFHKTLAATALLSAIGAAGVAFAQAPIEDPQGTPQTDMQPGQMHILRFADQGNSPESDPSAHLLLIKDAPPREQRAAVETTTTTVAETTPAQTYVAPVDNTPAPAAADTTTTDTTAAPQDTAPMPAPRADRN